MSRKKLVTLAMFACLMGTTGCERSLESIFLSEPPPPVLRPFGGIHAIRVTVTNVSPSQRLVPSFVAEGIVKQLKAHSNGLEAFATDDARKAEGVLAVSILEESGRQTHTGPQPDTVTWKFQVKFSAILTRTDGQTILSWPMQSVSQELGWTGFSSAGVTPGWEERIVGEDLAWKMGGRLVDDLAHLK